MTIPISETSEVLALGSQGSQVKQLQKLLNYAPSALSELQSDGNFGPRTEARVKEFQRLQRLAIDGRVGPQTMGKLAFTPGQFESKSAELRQHLVRLGASPQALYTFDRVCRHTIDEFAPVRAAGVVLIPVVLIFLIFCAAVIALTPHNSQAGQEFVRHLQAQLDALRKALDLMSPAEAARKTTEAIVAMGNSVVTRVERELERCRQLNQGQPVKCLAERAAVQVALLNLAHHISMFGRPGFKLEDLITGLLASLGPLFIALSKLGHCSGCVHLQFFPL